MRTPSDFGVFFDLPSLWKHASVGTFSQAHTLLLKLNNEEGGNGIARLRLDADFPTADALRQAIVIDKPYIALSNSRNRWPCRALWSRLF